MDITKSDEYKLTCPYKVFTQFDRFMKDFMKILQIFLWFIQFLQDIIKITIYNYYNINASFTDNKKVDLRIKYSNCVVYQGKNEIMKVHILEPECIYSV
jgi:hypothetical protein